MYEKKYFLAVSLVWSLFIEQETARLFQIKDLILGELTANYIILNNDQDIFHFFCIVGSK